MVRTLKKAVSDFLGQFSLVGLVRGTYSVRAVAPGFLPGVSWPQDLQSDTTLTFLVTAPESLAAWSTAAGGPAPAVDRGHLLIEARNAAGGAVLDGAVLSTSPVAGFAIPQNGQTPALLLNLVPGIYTVMVSGAGITGTPATSGVVVRAGEVTASRLDLPTGSPP